MARLRRARRNEPTLLSGPLRRIRTIRVLFVRIHAAHYRRKGAAAQRSSCPVRLFFTKAARGHRLGRMRLSSPRPPHISHAFVTCAHRLFVAGFRVPHRTSSRERYKGVELRATRILFKKRVECGRRALFLSGRDALHLTLHAKPQVTKYATWGFLPEYPFKGT